MIFSFLEPPPFGARFWSEASDLTCSASENYNVHFASELRQVYFCLHRIAVSMLSKERVANVACRSPFICPTHNLLALPRLARFTLVPRLLRADGLQPLTHHT